MAGEQTRQAIAAQPEWLARVPTDRRFPEGARLLFTGCGTSFHAAWTGGEAVQALELVLSPDRDADLLVLVSHEGETPLTLEAARAWRGPRWLVTGKGDGPIAALKELGCETTLVPTRHPAVDIVPFQRLALELALERGREPDRIRRHDERWAAAARAAKADNAA